jgi:hypothetical protein
MRTTTKIIVVIVSALLCISCANNSNSGDTVLNDSVAKQTSNKAWDDYQRTKDSLWTVFNESTDEAEVDKAREMLYEMASQADWNVLAGKDYERRNANVDIEFQQLISAHPEQEGLFFEEKERWEKYHEAVLAVAELEDHGSSGGLYITSVLEQSMNLWLTSFHNLWLYDQNQDIVFPETVFTSRMIDDAYSAYIQQEDNDWRNFFSDNEKDGMEEHHKAIENEWQLWNEWMAYRKTVSKALPKDMRKKYNDCTNLTMRTKLHQLKNQNKGLGLIRDDMGRCLLSDSCSDKELLKYSGFNVVLDNYLDSLEVESKRRRSSF